MRRWEQAQQYTNNNNHHHDEENRDSSDRDGGHLSGGGEGGDLSAAEEAELVVNRLITACAPNAPALLAMADEHLDGLSAVNAATLLNRYLEGHWSGVEGGRSGVCVEGGGKGRSLVVGWTIGRKRHHHIE